VRSSPNFCACCLLPWLGASRVDSVAASDVTARAESHWGPIYKISYDNLTIILR